MSQNYTQPYQSEKRQSILKALGLDRFLKNRRCIDLGELPVHCELYLSQPDHPVVLFIPGIGTYSEIYTEFLFKFSQLEYNLVSVDVRGHGYSGGIRGDYSVGQVVDDLTLVLDYVEENFSGPLIVFGCSIGSRLGLALAEADQRVKALVCHTLFVSERPPDIWHQIGWNWLNMNAMWAPWLKVNFRHFIDIKTLLEHNPMGEYVARDDLLVWEYTLRTLSNVYSYRSNIHRQSLDIPAMILVGENDHVIRPAYLETLIDASEQPFELVEIPAAGHMLPFDQIDESVDATVNWLKQQKF